MARAAARVVAFSVAAAALTACGIPHRDPGDPGCVLDTSRVTEPDAVLEYGRFGGLAGMEDRWLVRTNGTVLRTSAENPDVGETLASDPASVATLVAAVEETRVLDEDQGCYGSSEHVADSGNETLFVRRGSSVYQFQSVNGEAPDALKRALSTASRFVDALQ